MRPPKPSIKAGAIRYAKLEKLADRKDKADVFIGRISVIGTDPIADKLREYEEVELRVHKLCENAFGEDPLWYNEETRPDCKYSIHTDDDDITVWNFANKTENVCEV